jgi:hypothetical protein
MSDDESVNPREALIVTEVNWDDVSYEREALELFQFARVPRLAPASIEGTKIKAVDVHYDVWEPVASPQPRLLSRARFERNFPSLIRDWAAAGSTSVCLFVKGPSREFFDELEIIASILQPERHRYCLLPPLGEWVDGEVGNLLFEWPLSRIEQAVDDWFMSPSLQFEMYVGNAGLINRLAILYLEPESDEKWHRAVAETQFSLRVWPDCDGMFVFGTSIPPAFRSLDWP